MEMKTTGIVECRKRGKSYSYGGPRSKDERVENRSNECDINRCFSLLVSSSLSFSERLHDTLRLCVVRKAILLEERRLVERLHVVDTQLMRL